MDASVTHYPIILANPGSAAGYASRQHAYFGSFSTLSSPPPKTLPNISAQLTTFAVLPLLHHLIICSGLAEHFKPASQYAIQCFSPRVYFSHYGIGADRIAQYFLE